MSEDVRPIQRSSHSHGFSRPSRTTPQHAAGEAAASTHAAGAGHRHVGQAGSSSDSYRSSGEAAVSSTGDRSQASTHLDAMRRNFSSQGGNRSGRDVGDVTPLSGSARGGSAHWDSVRNGASIRNTNRYQGLAQNKASLLKGLDDAGADADTKRMVMACAMQETTHMSVNQRDSKKDHNPKSKNYSALNINGDMIDQLYGRNGGAIKNVLNGRDNDASLRAAAKVMTDASRRWGKDKTLMFLRSGSAPFQGGRADNAVHGGAYSGKTSEYFRNVGRIASTLRSDPSLMINSKRIEIATSYH